MDAITAIDGLITTPASSRLWPLCSRMLNALRSSPSGFLPSTELLEAIYIEGDIPLRSQQALRDMAWRLRVNGFPVTGCYGDGYRWAGHDVIPQGDIHYDESDTIANLIHGTARIIVPS